MPAANPNYYTTTVTIASASYPAVTAPSVVSASTGAGRWTIKNKSTSIDLVVSFDGTNDCVTVPAGDSWTDPSSSGGASLWIRLSAAGSVSVICNLVDVGG